jgi:hypothetical protein
MHPAALAASRAAHAHTAELQARAAENAKRDNTAAKFRTPTFRAQTPTAAINPFLAGSWNMTQQSLLMSRDPAAAARLKAEAGLEGIMAPSIEDARRAQSSGPFIAKSVAAAVKAETVEKPASAPQAAPERDSTSASPEALAMVRTALTKIGATVSPSRFLSLAEHIDGRIHTDSTGRVEVIGSDGQPLVDWRASTEAGAVVGYTVEKYLNVVHGIEPDAPKPAEAAKAEPEKPSDAQALASETKPLHVRVAEATAAGPEAVQALMAELTGR